MSSTRVVTGIRVYSPLKWGLSAWDLTLEREGPLLGRKVHEESSPKAINGKRILEKVAGMGFIIERIKACFV
jgi:hypothetical protein